MDKGKRPCVTLMAIPSHGGRHRVLVCSWWLLLLTGIGCSTLAAGAGFLGFQTYQAYQLREQVASLSQEKLERTERLQTLTANVEMLKEQFSSIQDRNLRIVGMLGLKDSLSDSIGGPVDKDAYSFIYQLRERELLRRLKRDLNSLRSNTQQEKDQQENIYGFLQSRESMLRVIPSINPAPQGFLSSGFEYRRDPFTNQVRMHRGLDIAHNDHIPVTASGDGVVVEATVDGAFGKLVAIDHGFGIVTRYAHLHTIQVKVGDKVTRGQALGTMGSTGRTTGNHLHYEVLVQGEHVDPAFFILG